VAEPQRRGPGFHLGGGGAGQPGDFLAVLAQAQAALNSDFTARFSSFLTSSAAQQKSLRPPHDPAFYPCGFSDCVYCTIRNAAAKTMADAQKQLLASFGAEGAGGAPAPAAG